MLGIWKSYQELEDTMTLQELLETYEAVLDREYRDRRFHAALQGVDIDEQTSGGTNIGSGEKHIGDITQLSAKKQKDLGAASSMGFFAVQKKGGDDK